MSELIRAGVIGGAGYTGGELIRLLIGHPGVELAWAHSRSQAGRPITSVHPDLLGATDQVFTDELDLRRSEVIFLCLGHGQSAPLLAELDVPPGLKIIDLSQDFRLAGDDHNYVYGLPELQREAIRQTERVANCGCFATAIQLALLPLAAAGQLEGEVQVHAITGSTGAGLRPSPTTHFSWRNNNVSIYKPFRHQHLAEIMQSLQNFTPRDSFRLNFLPLRGNFSRGIFASCYLNTELSLERANELYSAYYSDHPFVHLSPENPHLKMVVNTNNCVLHLLKDDGRLLIISVIDNLLKGASGQAVQNMNLMFELEETMGLKLKAGVF